MTSFNAEEIPSTTSMKKYRITGPQSVERLKPLLNSFEGIASWEQATGDRDEILDFVWETTCEVTWREKHSSALVLNKLHNTHVLESKSNLAFLQHLIKRPMIETYVATSPQLVLKWAQTRWASSFIANDQDWWAVKAANGNGGKDIWFLSPSNYDEVSKELPQNTEYVIQKYVQNPMLYNGKKFHFRCYCTMRADGSAMVYDKCFILTAGFDFDTGDMDPRKHITNLSVNKRIPNHPGQIPCHLSKDFPEVYYILA